LFSIEKPGSYPGLDGTVAGTVNTKQIVAHWDDILRLAASIEQGTASTSLIFIEETRGGRERRGAG
jgi:TnpA family transposase